MTISFSLFFLSSAFEPLQKAKEEFSLFHNLNYLEGEKKNINKKIQQFSNGTKHTSSSCTIWCEPTRCGLNLALVPCKRVK